MKSHGKLLNTRWSEVETIFRLATHTISNIHVETCELNSFSQAKHMFAQYD